MRKLILLALVVFVASVMAVGEASLQAGLERTDQLFFEDWDNPGNWDINTPPVGWVITDGNAGGNTGWAHYTKSGNDDGHVARITYTPDETNFDFEIRMDSISFDATGYTFINLNMDFILDYYASCDIVFQILVSTDDWSSSDVALERTYADGNIGAYDCWGGPHTWENVDYDLSTYIAGNSNVKLAFRLFGTDRIYQIDGLMIDNVRIADETGVTVEETTFGEIKVMF